MEIIILFITYLVCLKEGICQIRNPEEAATVQEHLDQVFHLARNIASSLDL